jgi:hypothetical protein
MAEGDRADRQLEPLDYIRRLLTPGPTRRDAVKHGGNTRVPGIPDQFQRRRDRIEVEHGWPAGNQDQVCSLGGHSRRLLGSRRCIDHNELRPCFLRGFQHLRQAGGLRRDDHRGLAVSSIAPVTGGSLRVEVHNGCHFACALGGNGQRKGESRLADTAFLRDYGDYVRLGQSDAYRMIQRRARQAGIETKIGNHSLRATGITDYLKNNGSLSEARKMANHADSRTTQLYDRRGDEASLDEYEKVGI